MRPLDYDYWNSNAAGSFFPFSNICGVFGILNEYWIRSLQLALSGKKGGDCCSFPSCFLLISLNCLNLQFVSILVFSITFEIYKRVIDFTSSPVTHPNTLTYTQLCGYEQNKRIWKKLKKKKHIFSLRTIFEKSSGSGMRNWLYPVRPTEPPSEHFWYARDLIDVEAEKSPTLRALLFTSIQYANKFQGKQLQCKCVICCKLCADKNISHMPIRKYRYIDGFSFIFWTFYHLPIRITCMFPLNSCYVPIHTGPSQPSTQFCLFEHKWMKIKHTLSNSSIANTKHNI